MKTTLRSATTADADTIARIVRESYQKLSPRFIPAEMPIYHSDHHAANMRDPNTRWALLYEADHAVGVASWRLIPGMSHLHLLFVSSDYQGRGYGVRLLHHHQQEAIREQPDTRLFTLHCMKEAHWAMRFYKHQGYWLYETGDEGHVPDLYLWIDSCRNHDGNWPLRAEKALFYKKAH